jgi:hypothetical protein
LILNGGGGNVLIGTTTDAGFRLDVNGTARVQGRTDITPTIATTNHLLKLSDNTNGTARMGFSSSANIGFFIGSNNAVTIGKVSSDNSNPLTNASQIVLNQNGNPSLGLFTYSTNVGIAFSDQNNGTIRMNFPSSGENAITTTSSHNFSIGVASGVGSLTSTTMKFFQSTGNVAIGTTTDAGYKLDVNGTARTGAATIQTLTVGLGAGSQSNNTVLGLSALAINTSGNFNVAIGPAALANNTTATGNVAIGHFAGVSTTTGSNNISIGREAFSPGGGSSASNSNVVIGTAACNTATGSGNVVLGHQAQAGNFNSSVVLGRAATADGNNQFVVGSTTHNAGIIDTATVTPDKRWIVKINGVNYYIALQTV